MVSLKHTSVIRGWMSRQNLRTNFKYHGVRTSMSLSRLCGNGRLPSGSAKCTIEVTLAKSPMAVNH